MLEQYYGMTLGQARELDIPEVTEDVGKLLYGQPFQIPAQFTFTGRAIGTLVGVSTGLAPDFNFVDVATPYARKFLGIDAENAGQTIQEILSQLLETGRILLKLPRSLEQVITRLETGQIEVKLAGETPNGRGRSRRRGRSKENGNSVGNLNLVLMFAASLGGGYLLFANAHQVIPASFFLVLSGLTGLRLLFKK